MAGWVEMPQINPHDGTSRSETVHVADPVAEGRLAGPAVDIPVGAAEVPAEPFGLSGLVEQAARRLSVAADTTISKRRKV